MYYSKSIHDLLINSFHWLGEKNPKTGLWSKKFLVYWFNWFEQFYYLEWLHDKPLGRLETAPRSSWKGPWQTLVCFFSHNQGSGAIPIGDHFYHQTPLHTQMCHSLHSKTPSATRKLSEHNVEEPTAFTPAVRDRQSQKRQHPWIRQTAWM